MKKILVTSHERSGTSLLINTIGGNFPDYHPESHGEQCLRVDVDTPGYNYADPEEMRKFLFDPRFVGTSPDGRKLVIRNQFKSHHTYHFFAPLWEEVLEEYKVFYIYRDGRDVLASFWRHVRKQGFLWGPMAFNVSDFMKETPVGAACRYQGPNPPENMVERWNDHILSWMEPLHDGILYIKYEDMLDKHEVVVEGIADFLGMDMPEVVVKPKLGGVHPWRGISGNWKEFFDEYDEMFFKNCACPAMKVIDGGLVL